MKDVTHHLRHVQKKIIQSSRKESENNMTHNSHEVNGNVMRIPMTNKLSEKKFNENHRMLPRSMQRPANY